MHAFRALRHRDYALYFSGQLVSWVGTWMQSVAVAWMVHRITGQPAWLGIVAFASQAPSFILAPVGGVRRRPLPAATRGPADAGPSAGPGPGDGMAGLERAHRRLADRGAVGDPRRRERLRPARPERARGEDGAEGRPAQRHRAQQRPLPRLAHRRAGDRGRAPGVGGRGHVLHAECRELPGRARHAVPHPRGVRAGDPAAPSR